MDNGVPKHIYVANRIMEDIKNGKITDKLPGERAIAKELGISYMTVRKAVENLVNEGILTKVPTKGTYINTRKKRDRTFNLGFFLDNEVKDSISSPYYSLVFEALEQATLKRGYSLMFFSNFEDLSSLKSVKKVDGLIASLFPRIENKILEIKSSLPVVVIGNSSADKSIPSVIIDNFNGITSSMEHLFALGHKRIGFISGLLNSDIGLHRLNGYKTALSIHGSKKESMIFEGDYSYEKGAKGTRQLLSATNPPTAVVCANDTMAMGAIKAACEMGLNLPEDLSIVGFDDITVSSQIHPSLTTVAAPIKEIAEHSVGMLIKLIEGVEPENRHVALPTRLVVRESSCEPKKVKQPA